MNHRLSPADDDKDKADKAERGSSSLMEQLAFKARFVMVFGEIDDSVHGRDAGVRRHDIQAA